MTRILAFFALLLAGCDARPPSFHPSTAAVDHEAGTLVVDLADGTDLDDARQATGLDLRWASEHSADEALAVVQVDDLAAAVSALAGNALVEAVEPSLVFQATGWPGSGDPDDPMFGQQWNFQLVHAPAGWRAGAGAGVVVAVIDTGVTQVADLADTEVLAGASFVPGRRTAEDDNGHGTHVAGTIAQSTNNAFGVTGIAPAATILPLKALSGQGYGKSEWIASAIDEAADQGAQVINLSLGGPESSVIRTAVEKAQARGVLVIAAAGNTGREGVSSPASLPGVIAVSATGPDDTLAPYSTWGKEVSISAPGGDKRKTGGGIVQDTVDSGKSGHDFKEFQGTSMATPHVAGAAAVLFSAGADSPEAVTEALLKGAHDLGEPGPDPRYGHGRLDIAASVRALSLTHNGLLFALGGLLALGVARMGGLGRGRRVLAATLAGAVTAGGLFFLPMLPLSVPMGHLLARPLLLWPAALLGAHWGLLPLFLSAALPVVAALVLGPTRSLGPLVAGMAAGAAAHMGWAAWTGDPQPWLLPASWATGWYGVNAGIALLASIAVVGVLKMRDRQGA